MVGFNVAHQVMLFPYITLNSKIIDCSIKINLYLKYTSDSKKYVTNSVYIITLCAIFDNIAHMFCP